MNLESPKVSVEQPAQYLFDSLSEVKNFETLMPESIVKFEVLTPDSFVFGLKGMPEITLQRKDTTDPNRIVFGAASNKLPFTLTINIDSISDSKSDVQLFFQGEFNSMMAMMVKGPIGKLIETLATNMPKL